MKNCPYSDTWLDHFNNPRNVGSLDEDDPDVATGVVGSVTCGDVMKMQIKVNEQGIISDVRFKTYGCGAAIASSSLATEWLKGKTLEEALSIDNMEIVEELSLPKIKVHCSVLAKDAIKAAIEDFEKKIYQVDEETQRLLDIAVKHQDTGPCEDIESWASKLVDDVKDAND